MLPHLGLDPSGFAESRCAFTLALYEARDLGLRHAHRLAPMRGNPVAQIRCGQRASDILRMLVENACRSARRPYRHPGDPVRRRYKRPPALHGDTQYRWRWRRVAPRGTHHLGIGGESLCSGLFKEIDQIF